MSQSTLSKSFIADICWVERGIAKAVPEKIEIEKEDLKELLQNDGVESTDDDDEEMGEGGENISENRNARGSASDLTEGLEKYKLEDYDGKNENIKGPSLKGLAYHTSQMEDPYITQHTDSDEEEERDDFELKETDNLVVIAKIVKDESTLEVWIYNENNEDWYLHHDYILDDPPLCLAPFSYDPGSDDKKGNLVAVGTMDSVIHIYDLDIVNAVEPVLSLGKSSQMSSKSKKKKKETKESGDESSSKKGRKKRDGSAQCHTEAVLCLDWNRLAEHVLASGSADNTVILWDLDEAKPATVLNHFNGMVQSLEWHPAEQSIILSGTRKGQVIVTDCRSTETQSSPLNWSIGEEFEIEKVLWNRFNPFCAFACSSDGKLRYMDTRKPGEFLYEVLAHEDGANEVSQSFKVKGLLTTVGAKELKVWKLESNDQIKHVYTHDMNMGCVSAGKFCPDAGNIVVVGAESEELVRIVDLSKIEEIVTLFNASVKLES